MFRSGGGVFGCFALFAALMTASCATTRTSGHVPRILVFYKAAGFEHASIPPAVAVIEDLGARNGIAVSATKDAELFTPEYLRGFNALVFVSTTGDVLPEAAQRAALEGYIKAGGGYLGIHAAADVGEEVRRTWPWYVGLVGAAFKGHTGARIWSDTPVGNAAHAGPLADAPPEADRMVFGTVKVAGISWEPARVIAEDRNSPAMQGWGAARTISDEWYGFLTNPRAKVRVLASVDEGSYRPDRGSMGGDHPIVWCHRYDGGRSVYTGLGHPTVSWRDPVVLRHMLGAIRMAAGLARFDCAPR